MNSIKSPTKIMFLHDSGPQLGGGSSAPRYPMSGAEWNERKAKRESRRKATKRKALVNKLQFWK